MHFYEFVTEYIVWHNLYMSLVASGWLSLRSEKRSMSCFSSSPNTAYGENWLCSSCPAASSSLSLYHEAREGKRSDTMFIGSYAPMSKTDTNF